MCIMPVGPFPPPSTPTPIPGFVFLQEMTELMPIPSWVVSTDTLQLSRSSGSNRGGDGDYNCRRHGDSNHGGDSDSQ
jgi:hypothetical protein